MAHSKSAAKRHRQSLALRERNRGRQTAAKSAVRKARELFAAGNREEAEAAVRAASSVLDRAAQKGVLHPNNAARRKSRLMRMLKRGQEDAPAATPRKRRATGGTRTRAKKS